MKRIVRSISPINKIHNYQDAGPSFSNSNRQDGFLEKKKVLDYFETVKKRAVTTNERFIRKNLPYRLRAYTVGKRAFIGLSIYDERNNLVNSVTRDITDADFSTLMDNLTSGSGLVFDHMPPWKLK